VSRVGLGVDNEPFEIEDEEEEEEGEEREGEEEYHGIKVEERLDTSASKFGITRVNRLSTFGRSITEGSKTNIPCCALLARQVRATFASDSRM
jgi:hypothetical protein